MRMRTLLLLLALLPVWLAPLHSQADPLYNVSPLASNFIPTDINNAGQISGNLFDADGRSHAALYSGGVATELGIFGDGDSYANAVNDSGIVTGVTFPVSGSYNAFVYDHGNVVDLGAGTYGRGINVRGDVVGQKSTGTGGTTSFLYSNGTLRELGNLGTGDIGLAKDINDDGKIVGESDVSSEFHAPFHPFLYSHGALHDLGSLAGFENNSASVINNAGRVAGYGEGGDGLHAFVYEHGLMTDLGSFGGLFLDVGGINEHGVFVGTADSPVNSLAFIYLGGVLVDLNSLIDPAPGWHIDSADGINDAGQIAAHGCRDYVCGALRLDLANAVPEPGSALLLLPGMIMLVGARRYRPSRRPRFTVQRPVSSAAA